ncbi:hypothetical protein CFN78_09845 [Amycolatopsis antarctica]|uniref:DUF1232 domain-containing protein n=1 Tax=Amycolatopsis antarctica TaxID=1854586 RepID=A0A263D484_9PSEU|nr:DUF1232 domain-containing protein [Amycolatopsis antarctica]OZM73171.1 hypothetical protein CFN78_09845 [Amycolatopsis antarctica]
MTGIGVVDFIVGLLLGLLLLWPGLLLTLMVLKPRKGPLRDAVRLLPDLLVMLRSMAADQQQRPLMRFRLKLLLAYVASPVDLVPDFIPGIGRHDDAIVATAALRGIVRRVGMPAVRAHWRGGQSDFEVLSGLCVTEAGRGRVPDFDPTQPMNHPDARARENNARQDHPRGR